MTPLAPSFPNASGTISIAQATQQTWDTLIVGAGVAGAATAILASQLGLRVLMVEAKLFPREKVCGGCLNRRAQEALTRLGVIEQVLQAGCIPLSEIHIQVKRIGYHWPIPSMQSIRRSTLDTLLVHHAISKGVAFLPNTTATIETNVDLSEKPKRVSNSLQSVRLKRSSSDPTTSSAPQPTQIAQAKSVVVAAGLTRSALKPYQQWPSEIEEDSRIGAQAILSLEEIRMHSPDLSKLIGNNPNQLHMLASNSGYAGICVTDGGLVDIAAAIDPKTISSTHPIQVIIKEILEDCGIQTHRLLESYPWMATPLLTRQSKTVAKPGLFLAGDSLGYVEPFTGEGMSWALDNAETLAPLLQSIVATPEKQSCAMREWTEYVENQRRFRQRVCRWVAKQARHPIRSQWVLRACQWCAPLRNRLLKEAIQ